MPTFRTNMLSQTSGLKWQGWEIEEDFFSRSLRHKIDVQDEYFKRKEEVLDYLCLK
jgi:hypothetical protein